MQGFEPKVENCQWQFEFSLLAFSAVQHPLHRRADGFVGPVDAAYPTAWAAFAFLKFCDNPFNVLVARFLLPHGNGPANPFVAG